ncbi:MAG: hypothetical protein V4564_02500, partial [Pseudomonadota bacterium]
MPVSSKPKLPIDGFAAPAGAIVSVCVTGEAAGALAPTHVAKTEADNNKVPRGDLDMTGIPENRRRMRR